MKPALSFLLPLLTIHAVYAEGAETYCRYEFNHSAHYGQVEGKQIFELDKAPWDGGAKTGKTVALDQVRLLHPSEPQVILGMAGTYKESWVGKEPFKTVRWFYKPPRAAASPNETIIMPVSVDELLVETELVIVIGKPAKNADLQEAKQAIFGYSVGNDIVGSGTSYHRIQGEPLDQTETLLTYCLKMGDGFAPFGPFIVRGVDWKNRERTLRVYNPKTGSEETYRHNTSNMIYPPEKIVSDISRVLTLSPGDIIYSGTTKALSAKAGDMVEVSVEGLGTLVNPIAAAGKP